jgi:hypothetical protein
MSLEQWAKNGWLRPHKSSGKEIESLPIVNSGKPEWGIGVLNIEPLKKQNA